MIIPFPICILSFERPALLSAVLDSLQRQTIGFDPKSVFLFQDAPRNGDIAVSGVSKQLECIAKFQSAFPLGRVFYSDVNLGVALNFDRAEQFIFEDLKAECGLFFEDDLVLSDRYLEALLSLADFALNESGVAYVAAYGDHRLRLPQQIARQSEIIPLYHKWGFALTRRQWQMQREIISNYLDIVRGVDYRARDNRRIVAYFESLGYRSPGSSQDAAKDVASHVLGTTKLNCVPCFGKYLGREGTSSHASLYDATGYANTEIFEGEVPKFCYPSKKVLDDQIRRERAEFAV